MNMVAKLLSLEDILVDIDVSGKPELFEAIGLHMEHKHGLRQQWVSQALSRREQVGSTGLGMGFAIPHARVKELERIQVAFLRLKKPIPFESVDAQPVFELLVLLVPKQATEEHLRILANATEMFSDRGFRARLQQCVTPSAVKRQFDAWPHPPTSGGEDVDVPAPSSATPAKSPLFRFGELFSPRPLGWRLIHR
jgi:nitrogen PTS system EIIA component